jgi:signal transduction histidine kinase
MAFTTTDGAATRRRVMATFLAQGTLGLLVMTWVTWVRREQTAAILHRLGPDAPILVAIFIVFASAMAFLKFELTSLIFVNLIITVFAVFVPILGGVLTSWLAVGVAMVTRWLTINRVGALRSGDDDTLVEYLKVLPGQFGTYGLPILVAATVYDLLGGEVPVSHSTAGAALRIAASGMALFLANLTLMFMPARAYGYSVRKVLRLDWQDFAICLATLPYAVVTALAYRAVGWGGVVALAFSGVVANFAVRTVAITRIRSQQLLQRLASLTNIGKTISLRYTTDQLLMAIYTECRKVIDCSLFTIALLDESSDELSFELDVREEIILPKEKIRVGRGLNSWVVAHHQPLLIGSVADEQRIGVKSVADSKPTESWLGVPMIARDRVIGVISVESFRKNAFTQDDVILLTAIANQAAVAIENAHLYRDMEGLTYALEHRVMERTNELRETNLRLMAADRSKNQFLANMSHELRTPLNSIIGFSSVLLENARATLQPRLYRFLENIHTAGNHLLELINDILDLSKIEAGKMELRADTFDLHDTIAAVERVMKGFAAEANVRITAAIDPALPKVRLDEGRLKQILFNLLSNAVKFSPAGGPVKIDVHHLPAEGSPLGFDTVRIDVVDHGIGIASDELARIFDEFYQTEDGRRSRRGGTGLGLSLTRNFVELHHGTIEVQSSPGHGSCFTMHLPVDYHEAVRHLPAATRLHPRGPSRISAAP